MICELNFSLHKELTLWFFNNGLYRELLSTTILGESFLTLTVLIGITFYSSVLGVVLILAWRLSILSFCSNSAFLL